MATGLYGSGPRARGDRWIKRTSASGRASCGRSRAWSTTMICLGDRARAEGIFHGSRRTRCAAATPRSPASSEWGPTIWAEQDLIPQSGSSKPLKRGAGGAERCPNPWTNRWQTRQQARREVSPNDRSGLRRSISMELSFSNVSSAAPRFVTAAGRCLELSDAHSLERDLLWTVPPRGRWQCSRRWRRPAAVCKTWCARPLPVPSGKDRLALLLARARAAGRDATGGGAARSPCGRPFSFQSL